MTAMEITLLVLGVLIFAASFFIKDKNEAKNDEDIEERKNQIRSMMETELSNMKIKVTDVTDETVEYAMDKAERSLEKISNEKIMAVNDYSNMIMGEIDKSHKEVMFLYDMLQDKQVDVKNSVRKAEATVKEVENFSEAAQNSSQEFKKDLEVYSEKKLEEVKQAADTVTANAASVSSRPVAVETKPLTGIDIIKAKKAQNNIKPVFNALNSDEFETITLIEQSDVIKPLPVENGDNTSFMVDTIADDVQQGENAGSMMSGFGGAIGNNNKKIIELHEKGMSTVDIAKNLNLGVGEVKLVIDLFKR
ncbi:MAG: hypothetical protein K6B28_06830 [Lachnospiraceae bacterium]|nr:hypothetical protein [Lachnospiraceae bacterium]